MNTVNSSLCATHEDRRFSYNLPDEKISIDGFLQTMLIAGTISDGIFF